MSFINIMQKLFVVCIIPFYSICANNLNLEPLTQELVQSYETKVTRLIRRDKFIKTGAIVSLLGVAAWCGYKIATAPSSAPITPTKPIELPKPIDTIPQVNIPAITNEQIWQKIIHLEHGMLRAGTLIYNNKTWFEWTKDHIRGYADKTAVAMVCTVLIGFMSPLNKYYQMADRALDTVIDKLFHDDSVNWFVQSQVYNLPTLTLLRDYAEALDAQRSPDMIPTDASSTSLLFVSTWHVYIKQLAAFIGFIRYKATAFAKRSAAHASFMREQATRLLDITEQERVRLQALLNAHDYSYTFTQSVTFLQIRLNQAIKEIALIESVLDC